MQVEELRRFGDHPVRMRLADESEFVGRMRTELLSPNAISVFLAGERDEEGRTIYIDQIVSIWKIS